MENKHLLLKELNQALETYSKSESNKSYPYNLLFSPLQKANKLLLENKIHIFNPNQEKNILHENLNGLGKLLTSSIKARNIIWKDNLGLVGKVAKEYISQLYDVTFEEIKSEGNLGLLSAIKNYNSNLKVFFSNYAIKCIHNSIKQNLNKNFETIKLPINFVFDYQNFKHFRNSFKEKFHYAPNDEELANFMKKPIQYIKNMKMYKKNLFNLQSLNCFMLKDGKEVEIMDNIIDENSFFEDKVINKVIFDDFIKDYFSQLPDRNKSILFEQLKGKTLDYIAFCAEESNLMITKPKKVLTRERIRQISADGIERIGAVMEFKEIKKICGVK